MAAFDQRHSRTRAVGLNLAAALTISTSHKASGNCHLLTVLVD
jgi:hypothetical protein